MTILSKISAFATIGAATAAAVVASLPTSAEAAVAICACVGNLCVCLVIR